MVCPHTAQTCGRAEKRRGDASEPLVGGLNVAARKGRLYQNAVVSRYDNPLFRSTGDKTSPINNSTRLCATKGKCHWIQRLPRLWNRASTCGPQEPPNE